jgi:hypothetical protein
MGWEKALKATVIVDIADLSMLKLNIGLGNINTEGSRINYFNDKIIRATVKWNTEYCIVVSLEIVESVYNVVA